MADYGSSAYWNERYSRAQEQQQQQQQQQHFIDSAASIDDIVFEWYADYSQHLRMVIEPILRQVAQGTSSLTGQNLLVVGTGTSLMAEQLEESISGAVSVVAIDQSSVAITLMKRRVEQYQQLPDLNEIGSARSTVDYRIMDARKMAFRDNTFDSVLDKAMLDSILCGEEAEANAVKTLKEIERILKPGGRLVVVSHMGPENREYLFKQTSLDLQPFITVPRPTLENSPIIDKEKAYFVYVAGKAHSHSNSS